MEFTIRKNRMGDGSHTFDLLISNGLLDTMEVNLVTIDEKQANQQVNAIHEAMEAAAGQHIPWNDTIEVAR